MNDQKEITYELTRPFGPILGKFTIPENVVDDLNSFTDRAVADQSRFKELDQSGYLAGEVTQELKIPEEIIRASLGQFLLDITATYVAMACGRKISRFKLVGCWIVRSFAGDYNPPHFHNAHVSGAGYLLVPPQIGTPGGSKKPGMTAGDINFMHGTSQFLSPGYTSFTPEAGKIYLFPHYLTHSVNPFSGKGERRSFSFNALVDDDIYNIYSTKERQ